MKAVECTSTRTQVHKHLVLTVLLAQEPYSYTLLLALVSYHDHYEFARISIFESIVTLELLQIYQVVLEERNNTFMMESNGKYAESTFSQAACIYFPCVNLYTSYI